MQIGIKPVNERMTHYESVHIGLDNCTHLISEASREKCRVLQNKGVDAASSSAWRCCPSGGRQQTEAMWSHLAQHASLPTQHWVDPDQPISCDQTELRQQ